MIPVNPAQIPALYKQAMGLQAAGRLDEARAIYQRILTVNTGLAEVHFQAARIDAAQGNPGAALDGFERALALKPGEPAIWTEAAQAVHALDDAALTRDFLARAKKARLSPAALLTVQERARPPARAKSATRADIGTADPRQVQQAIEALAAGRLDQARKRIEALLAGNTRAPALHAIRADVLAAQKQHGAALKAVEQAITLAPDYAEAHAARGRILAATGRGAEALAATRKALALLPGMRRAWIDLARMLADGGDAPAAIAAARRALALPSKAPGADAIPLAILGDQQMQERDFVGAEESFRKLVALDPGPEAGLRLAEALARLGRAAEALVLHDRLLAQVEGEAPAGAAILSRKASLLQTTGAFTEARAAFEAALALAPEDAEIFRGYALSVKLSEDDPHLERMAARFDEATLSDAERSALGFALAKVMEDLGRHDRVMGYLHAANAAARRQSPYDIKAELRHARAMTAAFAGLDADATPPAGTSDLAPIFVTGMPRSGTTLVEQILASHSRTRGIGEIGLAAREAGRLLSATGAGAERAAPGFRPVDGLQDEEIAALGHRYGTLLERAGIDPGGRRVIDKSIQTYRVMPLIRLALPASRVVVVRRDPRDTLLSIYRNSFAAGSYGYASDLRDLGETWKLFDETILTWRQQFPGWFVEVSYEALVADPEGETRRLLEACALEFEPGCLSFHQARHEVRTLSVYQVRQPIYASSLKGWRRYRDELAPMLEALDLEEDDDVAG